MYYRSFLSIVMACFIFLGTAYSDICLAQSQADKEICCQQQRAILAAKKRIDGYLLASRLISKAQLDTWGDDPKDLFGNPSKFLPMIDYYRALIPKAVKMGLDFAAIAGLREIDQAYQRIAVTCETPVKCDESGDNCDDEFQKCQKRLQHGNTTSCTEALLDCKKKADPNYNVYGPQ